MQGVALPKDLHKKLEINTTSHATWIIVRIPLS